MVKMKIFLILIGISTHQWVFAADLLELDSTAIKGARELPKVLYIVPWKKTQLRAVTGVSEKASFEEGMTALDRDVFLRENEYYGLIYGSGEQ